MQVFNTVKVLNLSSSKLWVAEWLDSIYYKTRAKDCEFKSTQNRMFFLVNGYLLKIELMQSMILFVVYFSFIIFYPSLQIRKKYLSRDRSTMSSAWDLRSQGR